MFVHFINNKPVAIGEVNLFQENNNRFIEFKNKLTTQGMKWETSYRVVGKMSYDFTISQTKLFTSHENFDTRYYDLIHWLSGVDNNRNITIGFK